MPHEAYKPSKGDQNLLEKESERTARLCEHINSSF